MLTSTTLPTSTTTISLAKLSYEEKASRAQGHVKEQAAKDRVTEVQVKVATKGLRKIKASLDYLYIDKSCVHALFSISFFATGFWDGVLSEVHTYVSNRTILVEKSEL